jgi:uncharacterized protein with NAD-binding domain and iron-sulfur cluster
MSRTAEKRKVIILGGGIAGMTAAHELIERGFAVTVYETKELPGGKARGIPVPGSPVGNRKGLPGEHGFRFFPGFYRHLPDTLRRIRCGKKSVVDNLVAAHSTRVARKDQDPVDFPTNVLATPEDFLNGFQSFSKLDIPDDDLAHFGVRLLVLLTSCQKRRFEQWETQAWWDFIGARTRSKAFQKYCADGVTRTCVACRADLMSARSAGYILLQLLFDLVRPGGQVDRLLNGPTNDAWLGPWLTYLQGKGVKYRVNAEVTAIRFTNGRIDGITVKQNGVEHRDTADYYVAALPVERVVDFLSLRMRHADKMLDNLSTGYDSQALQTKWMNGIQYFLKKDVPVVPGHMLFIDSEWSLTAISQRQFWPDIPMKDYGDGTVKGVLSVDISDWYRKGTNGLMAVECPTRETIESEVRTQLNRARVHVTGTRLLEDENIVAWFLDSDIVYPNPPGVGVVNLEPLLVNTANSYRFRPEAITKIPNLFLAGDYVRTNTDLATMEAANESARRAVNGILAESRVRARRCKIWKHAEPWILRPLLWYDRWRLRKGLPNIFDDESAQQGFVVRWTKSTLLNGWRATRLCWKGYHGLVQLLGLSHEPAKGRVSCLPKGRRP